MNDRSGQPLAGGQDAAADRAGETGHMTAKPTERDALRLVCEQLADRFPSLEVSVIELTVEEEYRQLDGPIRDFVPVLTQKLARDRLALLAVGARSAGAELVSRSSRRAPTLGASPRRSRQ